MAGWIRVFLVDDHQLVLDGLQQIIDQTDDIRVCGRARSLAEAREKFKASRPDMLVADMSLPDGNGLDLLEDTAVRAAGCPVVVLSMRDAEVYAPQAIQRGARGFVAKSSPSSELVDAIRAVRAGNIHLSASIATTMIERNARVSRSTGEPSPDVASPVAMLGRRERTVFELIGRGLATKEIAATLRISPKTVDTHRQRIRRKLGVPSAARLAALAVLSTNGADQARPAAMP